jgi:bacterioferritin-associated ferredoxin
MKCPTCSKAGQEVSNETVKHILKAKHSSRIGENDYYLCMNPDCDIAYYNSESVFEKSALDKPLWYKKDANPKYACYCRKITPEEVIKTIMETGLTEADDIMFHLHGIVKSNCKINNPTRHCCHPAFNQMIKNALENKAVMNQRKSKE